MALTDQQRNQMTFELSLGRLIDVALDAGLDVDRVSASLSAVVLLLSATCVREPTHTPEATQWH